MSLLLNVLEASLVAIQLHLDLVQLLNLLMVALRLVAHQRAVEVNSEQEKNNQHRDHDDGAGQCRLKAAAPVLRRQRRGRRLFHLAGFHRQELNPAEEHHLG